MSLSAPTYAEAATSDDVPRVFEAGKVSDYRLWKAFLPRASAPLRPDQRRPAWARRPPLPAWSRSCTGGSVLLQPVVVCRHLRALDALHVVDGRPLGKDAPEVVALTRDPFAFVDAPACLTQDDCDEMPLTPPNWALSSANHLYRLCVVASVFLLLLP